MTPQEAVKALKEILSKEVYSVYVEALKMAIKSLERGTK